MDASNYQISYVRVGSKDLSQAREFYETILGLPLITENIKRGYLLFDVSGITLIVEATSPEHEELPPGRYLGISLKVRDIEKTYDQLVQRGVSFTHPPEQQFWGGYLTEFTDPDGNYWTLLG